MSSRKGLRREFVIECIEHYQELAAYYSKTIKENEKRLKNENMGEKKRKGFEMLNEICKKELKECQKNIARLM